MKRYPNNEALKIIFSNDQEAKEKLREQCADVVHFAPKQLICCKNRPLEYVYIILKGQLYVQNDIEFAEDNTVDFLEVGEIVGFIEYLVNIDYLTANVIANTDSWLYKISLSDFVAEIKSDVSLCYSTLLNIGYLAHMNMKLAETHRILPAKDVLGDYLYQLAKGHQPYYRYPHTRHELSERLHINLRTLYRYIEQFEKENYLSIVKGKIVIEREHFNRLHSRYGKIVM